jgi:methylated-DNA-[protein]-cysteine S-methyltransferase
VIPYLLYADAGAAMDWLVKTFGFTVRARDARQDGTVRHGELQLDGGGVIMVGSAGPGYQGPARLGGATPMKADDDLARDLMRAFPAGPGHLSRLHDRLAAAAQAEGVLDVAYRTVDSPVGLLLLAATDLGLVRVAYVSEGHDAVLRALGERISPRILHAPARLDTVVRQIEEYFEGGRHSFDIPLDWRLSDGFRQIVLRHLPEIGYGHTASYAMVAQLAGRPRAVRAVGTACATNPLPVVVPCHRVVRSDGSTGGYLGGVDAKRTLLALERQ